MASSNGARGTPSGTAPSGQSRSGPGPGHATSAGWAGRGASGSVNTSFIARPEPALRRVFAPVRFRQLKIGWHRRVTSQSSPHLEEVIDRRDIVHPKNGGTGVE